MIVLTQEQLSEISGIPITLVDRTLLPFEEKFGQGYSPLFPEDFFSKEEDAARRSALKTLCPEATLSVLLEDLRDFKKEHPDPLDHEYASPSFRDWTDVPAYVATACAYASRVEEKWSDHSCAIGRQIFGDCFQSLKQGTVRAESAVILPPSPYLTPQDYWKQYTGLRNIERQDKTLMPISILHELGEVIFARSTTDVEPAEIAYLSEAMADGFAVKTFLSLGGEFDVVQDYISARRIGAVLPSRSTLSQYYTAAACEAVLSNKPLPSFAEARQPIDELRGKILEIVEKNGQDWFRQDACLTALVQTRENPDGLSKAAQYEADGAVKAFARFCPTRANAIFRPLNARSLAMNGAI